MGRNTKLNLIYTNMKRRCCDIANASYKHYGARGITLCPQWKEPRKGWLAFKEWALANGYKEGLTIDRINVNGNYEPSNCRWVTMKEQNNNRRNNHLITWRGQTKTLTQWAESLGISPYTLASRLNMSSMSLDEAMQKKNYVNRLITYKGETKTLTQWAKSLGIKKCTLKARIDYYGWSIERAFEEK